MVPAYFKKKGDSLVYTGTGEALLYIPEKWFDMRFAIVNGEFIDTMGILLYSQMSSKNSDPTKNIRQLKLPTRFTTKPGKVEKVKGLSLAGQEKMDYRILHYANNNEDKFMNSLLLAKDIENVEEFYRMFVQTGNIPTFIPYNEIQDYFYESMRLNGGNYKTNWQLFGLLISEICRDKDDISTPYYASSKFKKGDMNGYISIPIKEVPKYISPYSALLSENWNEAVVAAVNMGDSKNNIYNPMEKIMMGH